MTERSTPPPHRDAEPPEPPQYPGEPRLHPTNPATLVVLALGTAAVAWVLVANYYGDIPAIPWLPAFTIFALAAFEAVLARTTKARIDHKPGAPRVDVLAVARYVVLAKASSPAAAIFTGLYGGLLIWLLIRTDLAHARDDIPPTATGLVASLALVGAALWLERSCRVPKPPEDDK
ncbi:MAG: hypothetical protein AUI14_25590, partial [Actinobacteria bacterium 13_2_20CM_2_71_6]